MTETARRRIEDWPPLRLLKAGWPVILAVISIVAMWTQMDGRIVNLERSSPLISRNELRIMTLETKWIYLEKQLDTIDAKLDRVYQKVK